MAHGSLASDFGTDLARRGIWSGPSGPDPNVLANRWDVSPRTASQIINNMGEQFARTVGDQPSRAVGEVTDTIGSAGKFTLGAGAIGVGGYSFDQYTDMQETQAVNSRTEEQAAAVRAILEDDSLTSEEKEAMIQRLEDQGVFDDPGSGDDSSAMTLDLPFGGSIDMSPLMLITALITISIIAKTASDMQ